MKRATANFTSPAGTVRIGQPVPDDHPLVTRRPDLFVDATGEAGESSGDSVTVEELVAAGGPELADRLADFDDDALRAACERLDIDVSPRARTGTLVKRLVAAGEAQAGDQPGQ